MYITKVLCICAAEVSTTKVLCKELCLLKFFKSLSPPSHPECLAAKSGLNHAPEDRGGDQIEQLRPMVQHLSHECDEAECWWGVCASVSFRRKGAS